MCSSEEALPDTGMGAPGAVSAGRTIRVMETTRVGVAPGIELAVYRWAPVAVAPATDAVPFVLVHGLASNARLWDGVAERLARHGHPVIAVDLRGHGRSSKPDGPYDIPSVAADLATLIGRLGLDRPIVAGQSWGGNVVLELAADHPGAVRAICCVDGGWLEPRSSFPDWEACLAALAPPRLAGRPLAEIEARIRNAHPDWPEAGIAGTLANFELRADGTIAPWLTYERHIEVLRGMWAYCPSERYAEIEAPTLLLAVEGGDGAALARKREAVEQAGATIHRSAVRWFVGDHDIHAQHPEAVAHLLLELADGSVLGQRDP
jgi:pimeloyl-ACP methyl ester carboxylesterase